jgi:dipeptidyl aminopeptidase/acylaminoacyl peptidase
VGAAWSPDGKRIALGSGGALELIGVGETVVPGGSGDTVGGMTITDIAWSPDGSKIAFVRGQVTTDGSGDINPRALWIYDVRTETERGLRGVVDSETLSSFAVTMTWLSGRDPKLAVFGAGGTYLLSPNGRLGRTWRTSAELSSGSASPDGSRLLFVGGPIGSYLSAISLATVAGHGDTRYTQLTQVGK